MKYAENNIITRGELNSHLKQVFSDLLSGNLAVEGTTVQIPSGLDHDVKVKYATDEEGGNVTLKTSWDTPVLETEEEQF